MQNAPASARRRNPLRRADIDALFRSDFMEMGDDIRSVADSGKRVVRFSSRVSRRLAVGSRALVALDTGCARSLYA